MISKICEIFGKVRKIEMVKDPVVGMFRGTVQIEYSTESEASYAFSKMMGLRIEDNHLFVKKITSINTPAKEGSGEMFKALIEDKPTACLCLKNVVNVEEIEERIDYKELEFDVMDEMKRYGHCMEVVAPRPPLFGDPMAMPGFGKVFVLFSCAEEAEKAKIAIFRRRFNGRVVDAMYFPEDKFNKKMFI